MYIGVIAPCCSDREYNELMKNGFLQGFNPAQKFWNLLVSGLSQNQEVDLNIITSVPVLNRVCKKKFFELKKETFGNNLYYTYMPIVNIKGMRQVFLFFGTMVFLLKWLHKTPKEGRVILCESLSFFQSLAARVATKLFRCPCIGMITDIPEFMLKYDKRKKRFSPVELLSGLYSKLCTGLMRKNDGYILITNEMNNIVNPKDKPYMVLEGICDQRLAEVQNRLGSKNVPPVILYAGALHKCFGVEKLLKAFMLIPDTNMELWLYGNGDMVEEIKKAAEDDRRIRYWGVKPNEMVVDAEIRASLLINPRPSDEEYTKYSFPSKTMEYMATGTPVMMAPLPGMPQEYKRHVFLFEDESTEGMATAMMELLALPKDILHFHGLKAKKFVLKEKNAYARSGQLLEFFKTTITSMKKGGCVSTHIQ